MHRWLEQRPWGLPGFEAEFSPPVWAPSPSGWWGHLAGLTGRCVQSHWSGSGPREDLGFGREGHTEARDRVCHSRRPCGPRRGGPSSALADRGWGPELGAPSPWFLPPGPSSSPLASPWTHPDPLRWTAPWGPRTRTMRPAASGTCRLCVSVPSARAEARAVRELAQGAVRELAQGLSGVPRPPGPAERGRGVIGRCGVQRPGQNRSFTEFFIEHLLYAMPCAWAVLSKRDTVPLAGGLRPRAGPDHRPFPGGLPDCCEATGVRRGPRGVPRATEQAVLVGVGQPRAATVTVGGGCVHGARCQTHPPGHVRKR